MTWVSPGDHGGSGDVIRDIDMTDIRTRACSYMVETERALHVLVGRKESVMHTCNYDDLLWAAVTSDLYYPLYVCHVWCSDMFC